MFEKIKLNLANKMRSFLKIYPSVGNTFSIQELLDFDSNTAVNKLWYRGDSYELAQLYKQLDDNAFTFWGSIPTVGIEIRKIHTGLPKTMVNILTGAIVDDLQDVDFENMAADSIWEEFKKENDFAGIVRKAVSKTLVTGDGAFKISIDTNVSQYPILEFYEADRVKLHRERGRIKEIIFKTPITHNNRNYVLLEFYGYGYVNYKLTDGSDKELPLDTIPQTANLKPITWMGDFMLAEYLNFYASDKWEGRGQSVFDAKRDSFDALDEAWSQWIDALRAGRSKTYIPENLIPRNAKTGELIRPNAFDNRFIQMASDTTENGSFSKIETVTPSIQHESYLQTYVTALDLCLQGIISPSTLGIDTKKLDNAEAQREKEKATLYTRQTVVSALQKVLPKIIQDIFYAYQTLTLQQLTEVGATISFGEYANPSFESQVETVGKAKTQGIMSIKAAVDELYGDSKSEDWKAEEVQRIMNESGLAEVEEPHLTDLGGFNETRTNGNADVPQ